jgi:predicted ester cyclase
MSVDGNRRTIETMWGRFEDGLDWSVVEECYAPDYIRRGSTTTIDRDTWFAQLRELYRAFTGHRTEVLVTVAEGDYVCYQWAATARHEDIYFGAPPTGRDVRASGITISRFHDGRIVEERATWDKFAFLSDLRILSLENRPPTIPEEKR